MRFRLATLAGALLAFWPGSARAFKPPGHDAIEVSAYRRLFMDQQAGGQSGREILCVLVRDGFLSPPQGWTYAGCMSPAASEGGALPLARSGDVDADIPLQLGNGGQCNHFMAARIDEQYDDDAYDTAYGL